jgi:hypothetical protein
LSDYPLETEDASMSKKHFIIIARVVANIDDPKQRRITAIQFAGELAALNSAFDRQRFLAACNAE